MEDPIRQNFHTGDFVVFGAMLLVSSIVGIYFAYKDRNKSSIDSYFFGEKRIHPVAVGLSLSVAYHSSVGVISTPAEVYIVGTVQLLQLVTSVVGMLIVLVYFVTVFHDLPIRTTFQYLELRFNKYLARTCAVVRTVGQIFYLGLTVYVPASALNAVTPLPLNWSIFLTAGLCTFYTVLGGMKAVIWTDVLQFGTLLIGISAVFIQGLLHIGGFGNMTSAIERGERNTIHRFDYGLISRISPLGILLGGICSHLNGMAFTQQIVQRYQSCKTAKQAQCALLVYIVPYIVILFFNLANGMMMYAYYEGCDPVLSGKVDSIDQGLPYIVLDLFANLPGMAGLFIAAVFSGTLSTVSSGINAYSIVIVEDLISPLSNKVAKSERLKLIIGKVSVVVLGVCLVLIAFLASLSDSNIIQILYSFIGVTGGPLAGVFLLGFFCPWANSVGAFVGFLTGFGFGAFLFIGAEFFQVPYVDNIPPLSTDMCPQFNSSVIPSTTVEYTTDYSTPFSSPTPVPENGRSALQDFFNLNYNLLIFFGLILALVVGNLASLISGPNRPSEADPRLFIPLIENSCFPDKVRSFFRFGVPEKRLDEKIKYDSDVEDDKL